MAKKSKKQSKKPDKKPAKPAIRWLDKPADHNYPAAESYLSLAFPATTVKSLVNKLERAPVTHFKAKDIFRASGLSLLGVSNSHVEIDRQRIRKRVKLSPILLVRIPQTGRVIVADGYHRLCAVYELDEDADIPCQIV
jgi:hypothetical protein